VRCTRSGSIGISTAYSTSFVWLQTADMILETAYPAVKLGSFGEKSDGAGEWGTDFLPIRFLTRLTGEQRATQAADTEPREEPGLRRFQQGHGGPN
jgi:hypothetical protein